jgi:hypothetical protein
MEKGEKVRIEFHAGSDAALVVLDRLKHELDNVVMWLCNKELDVFLKWKGIAVSKLGNMVNRRLLFQQFASDRRDDDLGDPAKWTEASEGALNALRDAPIPMGDEEERRQNSIRKDVR